MVSIEEERKVTEEIAQFLNSITPEQKIRVRDILGAIVFLQDVPKVSDDPGGKRTA